MEITRIKEVWKENACKQIDSYSDSEIRSVILKSARKAIGSSYPGVGLISFLAILTIFCVWIGLRYVPQLQVLWMACIVILLTSICLSLFLRRKIQSCRADANLKEWLETRMKEFDRSINFKKRVWFGMTYGFGLILLLIFGAILMLTAEFSLKEILAPLFVGLIFMIIFSEIARRGTMKRMVETRTQLRELYDQLQD